jgi:hypothetical protein
MNNQVSLLNDCLVINNQPNQSKNLLPSTSSNLLESKNSESTGSGEIIVLRAVTNLNNTLNLSQASAKDFNFAEHNSGALSLIKDFKTKV